MNAMLSRPCQFGSRVLLGKAISFHKNDVALSVQDSWDIDLLRLDCLLDSNLLTTLSFRKRGAFENFGGNQRPAEGRPW